MNRTTKNIILIAVFAASVVGAFVLTKMIKANNVDNQQQVPDSIVVKDTTEQVPEDNAIKDTIIISTQAIEDEPVQQAISKMRAGEFQRLLIEGNVNYRTNKRIAKFVNIQTRGLREGDLPISNGDLMKVYEKISNGLWRSIRVIHVGYDEDNRINSVVIEPIYFEDQPSEVQSAQNQSDNQE